MTKHKELYRNLNSDGVGTATFTSDGDLTAGGPAIAMYRVPAPRDQSSRHKMSEANQPMTKTIVLSLKSDIDRLSTANFTSDGAVDFRRPGDCDVPGTCAIVKFMSSRNKMT